MFHKERAEALEQVAQRPYGISILGDIQNLAQSNLIWQVLSKGLCQMTSRAPWQFKLFHGYNPQAHA